MLSLFLCQRSTPTAASITEQSALSHSASMKGGKGGASPDECTLLSRTPLMLLFTVPVRQGQEGFPSLQPSATVVHQDTLVTTA